MSHTVVLLAKNVFANKNNYPECIVSYASSIINLDEQRRLSITQLWTTYRNLFRKYRQVKKNNLNRREIHNEQSKILFEALPNSDLRNDFHKCHNNFQNHKKEQYLFFVFQTCLEAFSNSNVNLMLQYVAGVNAGRHEIAPLSISFINGIPIKQFIEIVLFRLTVNH